MLAVGIGPIGPFELLILLFILTVGIFWVWPHWVLCKRVNWSPWLSLLLFVPIGGFIFQVMLVWQALTIMRYNRVLILLLLVPLVNLITVFWLAFSEWPRGETLQSPAVGS